MRTKIILVVLAVIVTLVAWGLMTAPTPSGSQRVGFNQRVENAVTTIPAGSSESRPSVTGADVNFGDRVATGAASRLEVSLLDRSILTVGALTRLEIDRFVYDPERDIVGVAVSVVRGTFRFVSNNRGAPPEAIAFRTRGGAIGIRGTMIEGVVGPEAVAFLAGIPGAPDLSAEADSAAVIILREGVIDITVSGQSLVLDRPVQMVAFTETRIYPPFGVSEETTRRFEALLPSRPGPAAPPTAPAPPPAPPVEEPVVESRPPVAGRDSPGSTVVAAPAALPPPARERPRVAGSAATPPPSIPPREPPRQVDPAPTTAPPPADAVEAPAPPPSPSPGIRPADREPSPLETLVRQLLTRPPPPPPSESPERAVPAQRARPPAEPQSPPPPPSTSAPRGR